jgi:hypothetical protein
VINYGTFEEVRCLLEKEPSLAATKNGVNCAIHGAARCNTAEVVELLIQYGSDINV